MFTLNILFYVFSIFLVFSSSIVVLAQHSVFSLFFLVISFLFSAFLLFLLECEFLGLLFILIYVGAIAIGRKRAHNTLPYQTAYLRPGIYDT